MDTAPNLRRPKVNSKFDQLMNLAAVDYARALALASNITLSEADHVTVATQLRLFEDGSSLVESIETHRRNNTSARMSILRFLYVRNTSNLSFSDLIHHYDEGCDETKKIAERMIQSLPVTNEMIEQLFAHLWGRRDVKQLSENILLDIETKHFKLARLMRIGCRPRQHPDIVNLVITLISKLKPEEVSCEEVAVFSNSDNRFMETQGTLLLLRLFPEKITEKKLRFLIGNNNPLGLGDVYELAHKILLERFPEQSTLDLEKKVIQSFGL